MLAGGPPGLLRLVFGEQFGSEEVFHGAVLISHDTARKLIDLLNRGLEFQVERPKARWGGTGTVIGSTSIH